MTIGHIRLAMLDGPYIVQVFLVALSIGWMMVLSQPYCMTCMPTYEGLHAIGGDTAWTIRLAMMAAVGMLGVVYPVMWLRVVSLIAQSIGWGIITCLFRESPTPPTAMGIYPNVVWISWWAIWRMSIR